MRHTRQYATIFVALAVCLAVAFMMGARAETAGPPVIPVGANAFGTTYGELGAQWWIWTAAIPIEDNPINDITGEKAAVGQDPDSKVFFLAGSPGGDKVTREVTVPAGKALFFPLINFSTWAPDDVATARLVLGRPEPQTEEETVDLLFDFAAAILEPEPLGSLVLELTVDGREIDLSDREVLRAQSGPFVLSEPEQVQHWIDQGSSVTLPVTVVSDGYWALLPPLSVGEHNVSFKAVLDSPVFGEFVIEVEYELTVAPPKK